MRIRTVIAVGALMLAAHMGLPADQHMEGRIPHTDTPLALDAWKDSVIIGTSIALNATAILLDRSSEADVIDSELRAVNTGARSIPDLNWLDRTFAYSFRSDLDSVSTGFTLTAMALPGVLMALPRPEWISLGLMYAESATLTWGIKELIKTVVPRPRPYMYYPTDLQNADDNGLRNELNNGDHLRSFPSGHTALAFNAAGFTSYVLYRYVPESPWKLPVSAAGYSLAFASSLLRLYSGNHFASDLAAGALIGTATGLIVPWLHGRQLGDRSTCSKMRVAVSLVPTGLHVRLQW
jgi:undecaprenyl-diphosphatase